MIVGQTWFDRTPGICDFVACVCLTSCYCSLLSIGAIAVNGYIYICKQPLYEKVYTLHNTVIICLGLWVFGFMAQMPNFIGWGDHGYDRKARLFILDRTASLSYNTFFSLVGIAVPVALIGVCYGMIYKFMVNNQPTLKLLLEVGDMPGAKRDGQIRREIRRQTITLFTCFVVFVICWAPYAFVAIVDYKDQFPLEAHLFILLLAHINSSLNSIIYGISNPNFRHTYLHLLGLIRHVSPPGDGVPAEEYNPIANTSRM